MTAIDARSEALPKWRPVGCLSVSFREATSADGFMGVSQFLGGFELIRTGRWPAGLKLELTHSKAAFG